MNWLKLAFVIIVPLLINGCGYIYGDDGLIKSHKYDYTKAKQDKPLKMPEHLKQKGLADFTVLPKIGKKAENDVIGKDVNQKAPTQLLAVLENTRVNNKSSSPSVLIIEKRKFLWDTIVAFVKKHKLKTTVVDERKGLIVSDWMAIEDGGIWLGLDGDEEPELARAKYKLQLVSSDISGEFELNVERIASQSRDDEDEEWREKQVSWHESADMMNILLSYYDNRLRQEERKHQQKIIAGFKVELGQDSQSNPALLTSADETLVWEKIPRVMRELGLTIIDKDIRQKIYFLEYKPEEPGFFASLFENENVTLPLEAGAYQISVTQVGEQRAMVIKDGQGIGLEADVLVKLFPDLSRLFGDRR